MTNLSDPAEWLDQYGDMLYRYACFRLQDADLAEDLVQETLIAAIRGAGNFAGQSSEKTWLIGILKHKIVDHLRKKYAKLRYEENVPSSEYSDKAFDANGHWNIAISPWKEPESELENDQLRQVLADCVAALPARYRNLFILREIDGMAGDEICKILGLTTTNNVYVMLSRARMQLRQCLERNWFGISEKVKG